MALCHSPQHALFNPAGFVRDFHRFHVEKNRFLVVDIWSW